MFVPDGCASRFLEVDSFRIHYLEAGDPARPTLVLLHSCDLGSAAAFSWEANIATLARHFHVLAPDQLGYGLSDKFYDFGGGHMPFRLRMLQRFLKILCVEEADFAGNSCGASMLLHVLATAGPSWRQALPLRRAVLVSPSAIGTRGPGQDVFDAFDGTREAMRAIVRTIFFSDRWARDEGYLDRRYASACIPGHWETIAAARLSMPGRPPPPRLKARWEECVAPVMVVTGDHDTVLIEKDGAIDNVRGIPGGRFHVVPQSGHCTQIEHPDVFHELLLDHLAPS